MHWRTSYVHMAFYTQPEVTEKFSRRGDMTRAVLLNYLLLKSALSHTLNAYRLRKQKWDMDSLFHVWPSWQPNANAHKGHASNVFFVVIAALFHMFFNETEVSFCLLCLDYLGFPKVICHFFATFWQGFVQSVKQHSWSIHLCQDKITLIMLWKKMCFLLKGRGCLV